MNNSLKNQLNYAIIFIASVVTLFIFLAENMHQIQYNFRHKNTILEYKPVRSSSQTTQQVYRLEKYQSNSSNFLSEDRNLAKNKNLENKKIKDISQSKTVDHQIFASPNSMRLTKRIFI